MDLEGLSLSLAALSLGVVIGCTVGETLTDRKWEKTVIEKGYGEYNKQLEFQWKEEP